MTAIIVEDELQSCKQLQALLCEYCPDIVVLGKASYVNDAFTLFLSKCPDLIFLDIELGEETGFDLLNMIGNKPFAVIFTTAHEQYGIRAIKFSALDYLLKPVQPTELLLAVQKAVEQQRLYGNNAQQIKQLMQQLQQKAGQEKIITVAQSRELRFLQVADIMYCASSNNYTNIFMLDGEKLTASKGIFYFDDLLQPTGFLRVHQSYLVNPKYIRSIKREQELELQDKTIVPVSRLKLAAVRSALLGE